MRPTSPRAAGSNWRRAIAALVVLAVVTGAGFAARNDPAPHALSRIEFRFLEAPFWEPRKPDFFARNGGFIPSDKGADCGRVGGFYPHYPYVAVQIHSTEIDCTQARTLVRDAHRQKRCKADNCRVGDFACRDVDAFSQTVAMVCRDGRSQVTWTWGGGY